jgi:restriction endonuclease Mrr
VSEDAVKGILITSGTFTAAARRFAAGKRLELIDGSDLSRFENRAQAKASGQ